VLDILVAEVVLQGAGIVAMILESAANVGADKDSDRRQREAIAAFARRAGYDLVGEFYDAAVSGADPVDSRPGFAAMLKRIESNGVRTIIVRRRAASLVISLCRKLVTPSCANEAST
jgi:hypothetical protein